MQYNHQYKKINFNFLKTRLCYPSFSNIFLYLREVGINFSPHLLHNHCLLKSMWSDIAVINNKIAKTNQLHVHLLYVAVFSWDVKMKNKIIKEGIASAMKIC